MGIARIGIFGASCPDTNGVLLQNGEKHHLHNPAPSMILRRAADKVFFSQLIAIRTEVAPENRYTVYREYFSEPVAVSFPVARVKEKWITLMVYIANMSPT